MRPVSFVIRFNQVWVHSDIWEGLRVPASSRSRTGARFPGPLRVPIAWPNWTASAVALRVISPLVPPPGRAKW